MAARGYGYGIPWLYHGGMWADATIMTAIIAFTSSRYGHVWSAKDCLLWAAVSLAVAFLACWVYDKSAIPESHTIGGKRTMTGWVHLWYTAYAIWFVFMFYFATPHKLVEPSAAVWVSVGLVALVFVGTHSALKIWDPARFGFKPFRLADLGPVGAVAAILAWRSWAIITVR